MLAGQYETGELTIFHSVQYQTADKWSLPFDESFGPVQSCIHNSHDALIRVKSVVLAPYSSAFPRFSPNSTRSLTASTGSLFMP